MSSPKRHSTSQNSFLRLLQKQASQTLSKSPSLKRKFSGKSPLSLMSQSQRQKLSLLVPVAGELPSQSKSASKLYQERFLKSKSLKLRNRPKRRPKQKVLDTIRNFFWQKMAYVQKEFRILYQSRIFKAILLVPCVYFAYNIGKYSYLFYQASNFEPVHPDWDQHTSGEDHAHFKINYYYPLYYRMTQSSFKEKLVNYVTSVSEDVFNDKEVMEHAVDFTSRLVLEPQTHEATLILLINVLKDERFIDEAKVFSNQLVSYILQQPETEENFKKLVVKMLNEHEVREASINLLKYIAEQKSSEDLMAEYFKAVFLREDLLQSLTELLTLAGMEVLKRDKTREKFGELVLKVAQHPEVKSGIYQTYLFNPMKHYLSFGYLSSSDSSPQDQSPDESNSKQEQPEPSQNPEQQSHQASEEQPDSNTNLADPNDQQSSLPNDSTSSDKQPSL